MLSIITPVLDGEKYIKKNIESIQKLKIPNEHIIVDGGSTDRTIEIISKYKNIKLIHQNEKTGMYGAINQGFLLAKGDYICWVNCDDQILPKAFEKMYLKAKKEHIDFINSDSLLYFSDKKKYEFVKGSRYAGFFLKKGIMPFVQPSSIYKASLFNQVGGVSSKLRIAGDIDIFHKIALCKKVKFGYLPEITTIFLKYGDSLGDKNGENFISEIINSGIPKISLFIRILFQIQRRFHFRRNISNIVPNYE